MDKVITPELARACTELSQEIRCQIGLVLTRRGTVERVIVGTGRELDLSGLAGARAGPRLLRGVRLVHTHLHNEPLSQDDLTALAMLRLDLIAAVGVRPDGLPADFYLAHLLPPNPRGLAFEVLPPAPFHAPQPDCEKLVAALEAELARATPTRTVQGDQESAILISASKRSRWEQEERLEELADLVRSNGIVVQDSICQRASEIHPRYLLGSGKLKEVVIRALQAGVDLLIFDQDLSPAQVRAIAELTDLKVVDRTQVILDIFARRAHSREGKIQVELAQLRYLLPRLSGTGTALSRLGGGIGGRGPGETKLETDRRRVRDRIAHLERELVVIARQRDQRRARRIRNRVPIISIVGYTNAGKSTLLNALTDSRVPADDRPFETLDTASRRLRFPRSREVIITDTVGFLRDLPKDLMGAFRTTLEELQDADILLHLVDGSARDPESQVRAVETILDELGLAKTPRLLVLNKCDRLPPEEAEAVCRRFEAIGVSALRPSTLVPMLEALQELLTRVLRDDRDGLRGVRERARLLEPAARTSG